MPILTINGFSHARVGDSTHAAWLRKPVVSVKAGRGQIILDDWRDNLSMTRQVEL